MNYIKLAVFALFWSTQALSMTFEQAINIEDEFDSARAVEKFLDQAGRNLSINEYQQVLAKGKSSDFRAGNFIRVIVKYSDFEVQRRLSSELMTSNPDFQSDIIRELNFTRKNQDFALNTLKNFYHSSSNSELKGETLRGILRNSEGQEMDIIVDALNDSSIETRVIARAIREDGIPAHLPLLVNLLRDHPDNKVRLFVRESLKELIKRFSDRNQRDFLYSCLPDFDSMPLSDHSDGLALVLNLFLFAGLPIISGDGDKEILPQITGEYAQTLISFYSDRLR